MYAAVLVVTLALRLLWIGARPLHHDESIHAYYSWRIPEHGPADYRYDPVYHGPTLYYATAVFLIVFGGSDFGARAFPVACSLGLVALAWPLRPLIGREAALVYALLTALSPTLAYYGRSLRHDVPMAFLTFAGVVAFLLYLRDRQRHRLYLAAVAFALATANKEDIYLTAFCFANALWIIGLTSGAEGRIADRLRTWGREVWAFLQTAAVPLLTAIFLGLTIVAILYTSLLTHPENWNFVSRALGHWWGQHRIQRIGGPWWYYIPLEVVYEPLIFFPALVTLVKWGRRLPLSRVDAFFAAWAVLTFAIYSWAQEKVPWLLVPSLVPQAVLAAHCLASLPPRLLVAGAPVAAFSLWSLVTSSFLYDAPRIDSPPGASHNEPMVYVQSTYDIHDVLAEIDRVTRTIGTGKKTPLVVMGDATWPLSWYLREHSVWWGSLPRETTAPVVIVDPKDIDRLKRDLGEAYTSRRFAVRGWWQIEWDKFTVANLFRFLLYRLAWNPQGTSDAVMFVARDLSSKRSTAPIVLTPPLPVRSYEDDAEPAEPARVIGRPGNAPGELREPRGIAIDSDGDVLVADTNNHRIQKLDGQTGAVLGVWGGPAAGNEPRQFRSPGGVAVAPDGTIYVADTWNHRIQKLDATGGFVAEWHEQEPGFWGPRALTVGADGTVFVADTGNKRIVAFAPDGKRKLVFGAEGGGDAQFVEPVGLAVDPKRGLLYVADTGNHRVQMFDLEGKYLRSWAAYGWEQFYTEPYLAFGRGQLVATDSFNHRINFYNPRGRLRRSIGGERVLNRPIGVAISPNGEVFASDTMNHRIVVYPPNGARD